MHERLLLKSDDLSLSKVIQLACRVETAATCAVKSLKLHRRLVTEPAVQKVQPASPQQDTDPCFPVQQAQQRPVHFWQRCGNYGSTRHEVRAPDCPAQWQACRNCNKPNHFARWCRSAPAGTPAQQPQSTLCFPTLLVLRHVLLCVHQGCLPALAPGHWS